MHILSFFTNSGDPATGLSPTINIRNVPSGTLAVLAGAMPELGGGFYYYDFTSYDPAGEYAARVDGGAGLANIDRYKLAGFSVDVPATVGGSYKRGRDHSKDVHLDQIKREDEEMLDVLIQIITTDIL